MEARATQHARQRRLVVLLVAGVTISGAAFAVSQTTTTEEDVAPAGPVEGTEAAGVAAVATTVPEVTTTSTPAPTPVTLEPLPDEPGLAPVITRVETDDPVVFLTIDDGVTRDPEGLAVFDKMGIPATLFLIDEPVQAEPEYFQAMPDTLVESHTRTHANLVELSEAAQRDEICGNADLLEETFGRRPVLFRPPFGNYNEATRRAAAACGMRAVVLWQENVNWDVIGFREVQHFRPGDIILMHFRPQFVEELNVISAAVEEAGLRFALLEDYLVPESVPGSS